MKAAAILERIREKYSSAARYRDSGTIAERLGDDGDLRHRGTFRTDFARAPLTLEFELTSAAGQRLALSATGDTVTELRIPSKKLPPPASLAVAVATLIGFSDGVAQLIPRLLLPDAIGGHALWQGKEPALVDGRADGAEPSTEIEVGLGSRRLTVLVNTETFVIRRVVSRAGRLTGAALAKVEVLAPGLAREVVVPSLVITYSGELS